VKDLQAQLDRANQQIESYRKAGMAQHRRNSDRATEPVEHSNMPAADARRLVIEADYKHQNSGPLDLVDTQIALTAAKCLIAELDRATEQAQALKESTASALQVLKDDRDVLYRELRESQDVDRATEPRPMSEAPRDGTWFTASIDVAYDSGRACWEDTGGFIVELRRADGWLPTSSGGEVR
jgi:hypothetical protein